MSKNVNTSETDCSKNQRADQTLKKIAIGTSFLVQCCPDARRGRRADRAFVARPHGNARRGGVRSSKESIVEPPTGGKLSTPSQLPSRRAKSHRTPPRNPTGLVFQQPNCRVSALPAGEKTRSPGFPPTGSRFRKNGSRVSVASAQLAPRFTHFPRLPASHRDGRGTLKRRVFRSQKNPHSKTAVRFLSCLNLCANKDCNFEKPRSVSTFTFPLPAVSFHALSSLAEAKEQGAPYAHPDGVGALSTNPLRSNKSRTRWN